MAGWTGLRSSITELGKDEAHVWIVRLDQLPQAAVLLSADERERADRFHFQRDKNCFINSRAALRQILGSYLSKDPGTLEFTYNPHGKPHLPGTPLQFNLSHSGELALIAITTASAIGVDVELIRDDLLIAALADAILSDQELTAFREMSPAQQQSEFFRIWVIKEAYTKAIGKGLSIAPGSLEAHKLPARIVDTPRGYSAAIATPVRLPNTIRVMEF
jgi:4'-phosphopantetheinyl transferase